MFSSVLVSFAKRVGEYQSFNLVANFCGVSKP